MPGLLIDRKKLVKYKMDNLLKIIGKPPKTSDNIGVIFLVNSKKFNKLNSLPLGSDRTSYSNSKDFIKGVYDSYYVVYNNNKKICEISDTVHNSNHLEDILHSLVVYLPRDVLIWTSVSNSKKSNDYIKSGFNHPYFCRKSPLGRKFKTQVTAFIKSNNPSGQNDESSVKNKLKYIQNQRKDSNKCAIFAKLTPNAVKYLKKLNKPSSVMKNKDIIDKELSGSLKVSKVVQDKGKIIFELSEDPKSILAGVEEEVDAVWSRYNFHTHPKKAYINHDVTNGWPSSQDYVGFIDLDNHTIFHTVVTLEGIYIISFTP